MFRLSFDSRGNKGFLKASTSGDDALMLFVHVLNILHLIVLLFTTWLPPLNLFAPPSLSFSSSPSPSSSTHLVYVDNLLRVNPQRNPAAAGVGTLSRLASSFIFCSSLHAIVTKASTSTCFPHDTIRQSRTHNYACGYTQ